MHKIVKLSVLAGYRLQLTFDDAVEGVVDLSRHVGKGVFASWADPEEFRKVSIGGAGELYWGEAIDLCPDALYLEVTGKRPEDVFPGLTRAGAQGLSTTEVLFLRSPVGT